MRKAVVALILAAASLMSDPTPAATTAPPCWPKQIGGTGSNYQMGVVGGVRWVGWTCGTALWGFAAGEGYVLVHPAPGRRSLTALARAYWDANVNAPGPDLKPAWLAMAKAFGR